MKIPPSAVLLWLLAALLLLLAWMTVTGRLGDSRHGYGALRPPAQAWETRATNPLIPLSERGNADVSSKMQPGPLMKSLPPIGTAGTLTMVQLQGA